MSFTSLLVAPAEAGAAKLRSVRLALAAPASAGATYIFGGVIGAR